LVRSIDRPAYVAPKLSPGNQLSDKRIIPSKSDQNAHEDGGKGDEGFMKKLRPDADCSGTAIRHDHYMVGGGENRIRADLLPQALNELKENCRLVLRNSKTGISYLNFTKAYYELHGKPLDLDAYGFLAVIDLVEAMPDLFVMQEGPGGGILKERESSTKTDVTEGWVPLPIFESGKQEIEDLVAEEECDEEQYDAEEILMQKVWDVIMQQPDKSLFLHEIPAAYEAILNEAFPNVNMDDFGLRVFEYGDRFSFKYDDDGKKLELMAEPEWAR